MSANRIVRRSEWRRRSKKEKVPMPFQIFEDEISKTKPIQATWVKADGRWRKMSAPARRRQLGHEFARRLARKDRPKPPKAPYYVCAVKPPKPRSRAEKI